MTRCIGALLIAAGSIVFGIHAAAELKKQIGLLDALCTSLRLMSAELETRLCPLPELIAALAAREGAAAEFYGKLSRRLSKLGEEDFYDIWLDSLQCLAVLSQDELSALDELGAVLGRYELKEQLASIEMCINTLSHKGSLLRDSFRERSRLMIGIPAAVGAMILTVLI